MLDAKLHTANGIHPATNRLDSYCSAANICGFLVCLEERARWWWQTVHMAPASKPSRPDVSYPQVGTIPPFLSRGVEPESISSDSSGSANSIWLNSWVCSHSLVQSETETLRILQHLAIFWRLICSCVKDESPARLSEWIQRLPHLL